MENKIINAIRMLSVDQIQEANSGHPGICLGAAPIMYSLFSNHMNFTSDDTKWFNRDRFILSAGHGSPLLYSILHLIGCKLTIEDLKNFRQLNSKTPGHPEYLHTDGVEATSGPLGQGIAQAVGFAAAEKHLSAKYNRDKFNVVDHYTYCLVGDGDLMEGVSSEAASFAGHNKLSKLIVLYDSNNICLDGDLDTSFSEDVLKKFEAMGWHVDRVSNGNEDIEGINKAIYNAKNSDKPSLIEIKTTIGFGSLKAGKNSCHGAPFTKDEYEDLRKNLDHSNDKFVVDNDVYSHFKDTLYKRSKEVKEVYDKMLLEYKKNYEELYHEFMFSIKDEFKVDFNTSLKWRDKKESVSTRVAFGESLNILSEKLPSLFGGSADLFHSNMTYIKNGHDFYKDPKGKNIFFGVREFAMSCIANGIMIHGGLRSYVSTFFVFSDYLKPAMRLSAIQKLPLMYVLTHDSIAVGEDGPTHEPIEQLPSLRSIPNVNVMRPCDCNELNACIKIALENKTTPSVLVLSRQNIEVTSDKFNYEQVEKGGYMVREYSDSIAQIVATGSEVSLALMVSDKLKDKGIEVDVISMPSFFLFDKQEKSYRDKVLKPLKKRFSLEMASEFGWHKYVDYPISINEFGASGNGNKVMEYFGFNVDIISNKIEELIK